MAEISKRHDFYQTSVDELVNLQLPNLSDGLSWSLNTTHVLLCAEHTMLSGTELFHFQGAFEDGFVVPLSQ